MKLKIFVTTLLAAALALAGGGAARADMIGIDVSRWQGEVNWEEVRTQVGFAMIKAGGEDDGFYADAQFRRNRDEVRRLGIPHGFYFFSGGNDPVIEAEHFASLVMPLQPGEILALDFEVDHPNPVDFVRLFTIRTEQLLGVKPMLYTYMSKIWEYDWQPVAGNGTRLWGAIYDDQPQAQPPAGAWPSLAMKQFTDSGTLRGISANTVDLNYFSSGVAEFQALNSVQVGQPPAAPPQAPPVEAYRDANVSAGIGSTFSDVASLGVGEVAVAREDAVDSPQEGAFSGARAEVDIVTNHGATPRWSSES